MVAGYGIKTSLVGRVSNYKLKPNDPSKALLPVFEAVVNSIHSIEELCRKDGSIDIVIERQQQGSLSPEVAVLEPIENFIVRDNGIGFNNDHFNAFLTSDTDYKAERGGKGIGRFAWLKAFDCVSVQSKYVEDQTFYQRSFNFKLTEEAVHDHENQELKSYTGDLETTVKLLGYKANFRSKCPKTAQAVASRIIEHCLPTFLKPNCPKITLVDAFREEKIVLNDLFQGIKATSKVECFKCDSHEFYLTHLRVYSASEDLDHRMHLFGQEREVDRENLTKRISFLKSKNRIQDEDGRGFIYLGYLVSKYLDDNLNAERTGFNISREASSLDFQDDVSMNEILEGAAEKTELYLESFIQSMAEENFKRVSAYILREKPLYRPLLKYKPKELERLAPGLAEAQLDIELYKIYTRFEVEIKEKAIKVLKPELDKSHSSEEKKKAYLNFLEESNALGKSKLAEYVVHRKVVLDLLETRLFVDLNGKYSKEEVIHDIIFPRQKTSNDIPYEQQNLWIIDEKLSYHQYLASDIKMNNYEGLDIDSKKRPDIAIFNNYNSEDIYDKKFVFVPDRLNFSSVIILEFKRPQRQSYNSDDPVNQVTEYIKEIQAGKVNDKNGRPITIKTNTPFYTYIICDLTESVRSIAINRGFTPSPDNDGYFWYNSNLLTYYEIVSYQKLIKDAKERNAVLFEKLDIRLH